MHLRLLGSKEPLPQRHWLCKLSLGDIPLNLSCLQSKACRKKSAKISITQSRCIFPAVHGARGPSWPAWTGQTQSDPLALLHAAAEDVLRIWPVGRAVNMPRDKGPELLAPGMPGHAASSAAIR